MCQLNRPFSILRRNSRSTSFMVLFHSMSLSLFPTLLDHPSGISFAQQEADEKIELMLRQHFVTQIPWIIISIIGVILPKLITSYYLFLGLAGFTNIPFKLAMSLVILWYLLILAYITEKFLHWYFNIYIVTNEHLVDINFHNLLNRDVVEVRLEEVQSGKAHIKGIFGSLFNYGDVIIETAAERQNIQFLAVPKPDFVADRIQDLREGRI